MTSSSPLTAGGAPACVIVPAYQAARSIGDVVRDLAKTLACDPSNVFVVDDGSTDGTADVAEKSGARVVRCLGNGGKGAALVRGFREAERAGFALALTVDADGQHPAESALEVLMASDDPMDLVLGVRDLRRDGAPRKNRFSNGVSNFFLSRFSGRPLRDTQCGLRRYPIRPTLALGASAKGYAFEAEVILRAIARGIRIVEREVRVIYPAEQERVSHFDSVRDPARIVGAVVSTLYDLRRTR
jgi:glycosyltransferase involved in cell wall biosynthesis